MDDMGSTGPMPMPVEEVGVAGFSGVFSGMGFGETPPLGPDDILLPGPGNLPPPPICGLCAGNLWLLSLVVPGVMGVLGPPMFELWGPALGCGLFTAKGMFAASLTLLGVCGVVGPPVYFGGMSLMADDGVVGPPIGVEGPPCLFTSDCGVAGPAMLK